jgi:hypothetical protein
MAPVSDAIEARNPILAACDRLPVDDAGLRAQPRECLDNEREAIGQVIARPAVEPHPVAVLAGDAPEPSHLISCSHSAPEGRCEAFVGRHGAMNPAGRARGRNDITPGVTVQFTRPSTGGRIDCRGFLGG